jgi:structure-specific recognition protein 1
MIFAISQLTMAAASSTEDRVIWKHIGLHGHSVGTFTCDDKGIQWKSAVLGGRDDDGAHGTSTTRFVPSKALQGAHWTVFGRSGHLRLQTAGGNNIKHELRFDGFPPQDVDLLKSSLKTKYNLDLQKHNMSSAGTSFGRAEIDNKSLVFRQCILEDADEEGQEFEPRSGDEFLSLDLTEVSQCVLPGNNRHEIELQFPESDTVEVGTDQLVAIRFYIPPDPDADPNDRAVDSNAELMQQRIMQAAKIKNTAGNVIVEFEQNKGTFLTPRGRYAMELTESFLRMRGQKYDYKIRYDDISRLFLLPRPDDVHMAFVIALDKPIRQGQQRYQYLVLQTTKEPDEVTVNLDEDAFKNEYNGELQPIMQGALSNLIAKTFKVIARKKVFIPGKFANATQHACVRCALRANEGLLYPLEKQFLFIHKPTVLVRFDEVESVEFQRYAGGQGSTRNFDLCVTLKASAVAGAAGTKEYVFSGIERSDYASLYSFLSGKKIRIKNLQEDLAEVEDTTRKAPVYNEDEIYGGPDEEMLEESEDEDYDDAKQKEENEEEEESEDDMDSEDFGSEVDDKLDSDLEDARGDSTTPKKEKKKDKPPSKKRPAPPLADDEDDDDDDDGDGATPKKKAKKKKKDPNAPKKAMSSYMLFSNAMRSTIASENPDASFGDIARLIAAQFKALPDDERREWDEKAAADKQRYKDEMDDYIAPSDDDIGVDADAKKGKKKKDPNAPKRASSAWMYYLAKNRAQIKEANPDAAFGDVVCDSRMLQFSFVSPFVSLKLLLQPCLDQNTGCRFQEAQQ